MIRSLEKTDLPGILHRVYNVFEEALPEKYAEVFRIKDMLLDLDALCACMTGSGPTVFALYTDRKKAEWAAERMRRDYPQTYLASIVNVENMEDVDSVAS
jgi:4-diphosphocytidyl-2-C-methyl-D-erythritol kinase